MKKTHNFTTIILILIMIAGLSLLLYPSISDYWNSFHQTQAIAVYAEEVSGLSQVEYERLWTEAQEYNQKLAKQDIIFMLPEAQKKEYEETLDISGTGIMGYIEIPSIRCSLPIYHGTEASALQIAAGHLEWSSLPVGGESSHCVISGHRGLPSAKLFSNLDQLKEGDCFVLRVLDEVLTYEVDQILIVEPQETEALTIEPGKDLCTLVTCTPYGVNTHRLLVRGHRVENLEDASAIYVTADAMQIEPLIVAPVLAVPILLLLLIAVMLPGRGENKERKNRAGRLMR